MTITETILNDHASRKGAEGVTWFTDQELARLGIGEPLFSVYQNLQHTLKSKRMPFVAEAHNHTDQWCVKDL